MTFGKLVRSFSLRRKRPERSDSVTYTLYNANPEILASSSKRTKRSKSLNLPRNTVSNEIRSDEPNPSFNRAERSSSFTFTREPEKEDRSTFTLPRRKKSKQLQTSTYTLYNINNLSKEVQTSMLSLCSSKDVQTSTSNLSSNVGKGGSSSSLTKDSGKRRISTSSLKKQKDGSVSSLSKESVKLHASTSSLKKQKVGSSSEILQTSSSTIPSRSDSSDAIISAPQNPRRSSSYDRTKSEPAHTSSSKSTRVRSRSSSLTFTRDPQEKQTSTFTLPRRRKSKETSTLTIYNIHNLSKEVQTSLLSVCSTKNSQEIQTSTSSFDNKVTQPNKPIEKDKSSTSTTLDKSTNTEQSLVAVPLKPPRNTDVVALNISSSEVL